MYDEMRENFNGFCTHTSTVENSNYCYGLTQDNCCPCMFTRTPRSLFSHVFLYAM